MVTGEITPRLFLQGPGSQEDQREIDISKGLSFRKKEPITALHNTNHNKEREACSR
jgi:hypothetical protein